VRGCNVGITDEFIKYDVGMLSCDIYIRRFMNVDIGVQAIFKFYLRSLIDCNVGISDGKEL
jgi:hypothetical protein